MREDLIYLDNAATSFPKPPCVAQAMLDFLANIGANPGRSAHRLSVEAAELLFRARQEIAALFNVPDPLRVVLCASATEALNLALHGLLRPGDHVVTSSVEHNAVMRPLRALGRRGVAVTFVRCSPEGQLDPQDVQKAVTWSTKLIVLAHGSNVLGTLLPIREVGRIARERGLYFLVDAAQTAGCVELDCREDCVDLLAFTGHKALYGPQGTGGLIVGERVDPAAVDPLIEGGTASRSDSDMQPAFLPDRFESGTPNTPGIAGLAAAAAWVREKGVQNLGQHELVLTKRLLEQLRAVPGLTVYGPRCLERRTGTVSFTVRGTQIDQFIQILQERYGVLCRAGLHCAPNAHRTAGTFPEGTVRFSVGAFNTEQEIDRAAEAVRAAAKALRA